MQICHLQTLTLQIYALHHLKGECTNTCYSVSWKLLLPLSEVVICSSFPSPLTGVKLNQFASVWEKQNWLSTLYSTYDRLYKMEVEAKAGVWSSISSFTDLTILNLKNTRAGRRKLLTSICFIAGKSELSFGADLPGRICYHFHSEATCLFLVAGPLFCHTVCSNQNFLFLSTFSVSSCS